MWVKICGNTNLDDAKMAAAAGADALGFIFASSPRRVTARHVEEITKRLPSEVEKIGVFVNSDFDEIASTVWTASLTGVQLHAAFSAPLVKALAREFGGGLRLIQVAHWNVDGQPNDDFASHLADLAAAPEIDAVLVDSRTPKASGGTGVPFDWTAASDPLASLRAKPLIVAGGLTASNVQDAIRTLRPWGVEVSSGVESSPGKKDAAKVKSFIAAARAACSL